MRAHGDAIWRLVLLVAFLGLWEGVVRYGNIPTYILPSP